MHQSDLGASIIFTRLMGFGSLSVKYDILLLRICKSFKKQRTDAKVLQVLFSDRASACSMNAIDSQHPWKKKTKIHRLSLPSLLVFLEQLQVVRK